MMNSGDKLVECPYDSSHMIEERVLGKHLIKCRENHKGHKKVVCRFDKTHLVPKPELQHHLSVCTSRYLLDREMQLKASKGEENVLIGDVKGPEIVTKYVEDDEDETWESVPTSEAPVALFNRKQRDFDEENESSNPRLPPGANYKTRPKGRVPQMSGDAFRESPVTLSKAAQISETSRISGQPSTHNQVYKFSLFQATNAGWGRGRGAGH